MTWKPRTSKDSIIWDDGRFTIQWSADAAAWVMYDRLERKHYHDLPNLGVAMDKAAEIWNNLTKIGLVACCKTKLAHRTIAECLYCSDLFQKAASYCRRHYRQWFILSAKHGLVCPSQVLEPYEQTLVGARQSVKKAWAELVFRQLAGRGLLSGLNVFYVHAGQEYTEQLLPLLEEKQTSVELPVKGLAIGQQLKFYKDREAGDANDHRNHRGVLHRPAQCLTGYP